MQHQDRAPSYKGTVKFLFRAQFLWALHPEGAVSPAGENTQMMDASPEPRSSWTPAKRDFVASSLDRPTEGVPERGAKARRVVAERDASSLKHRL